MKQSWNKLLRTNVRSILPRRHVGEEKTLKISIFTLFFLTRVINISKFPLFADEAFYVRFGYRLFEDPSDFLFSFKFNTQPLFVWLTAIFLNLFKNPILAARLVSVFAGFLNLVLLFLLVKKFFPEINSFFPLFFYLFLPFNLLYDRLALLESLTLFTISLAVFATLRLIKKPSFLNSIFLTFAFLTAALTKQIALFGIILSLLFTGEYLLTAKKRKPKSKLIATFLLSIFIFFILFISISLLAVGGVDEFILHFIKIPGEHFMGREGRSPLVVWQNSKLNFFKLTLWLKAYFKMPIFIFTLFASFYALINFKKRAWRRLLIWLAVVVILEIPLTTIFYPRHLLPITIPIIILNSYALTEVGKKLKKQTIFLGLLLFLPCLQFGSQLLNEPEKASFALEDRFQYFEDWTSGKGYDQVAIFLNKEAQGKKIAVFVESDDLAFIVLRFNPWLANREIFFSEQKALQNPIKVAPEKLFREYHKQEKYIVRNCHQALPDDWPVKLVETVSKSSFCQIKVYQVLDDKLKY